MSKPIAVATIRLQPFRVPNFVLIDGPPVKRQTGFTERLKFALTELDADTLSALCDQFRVDVFEKAGKDDPKQVEQ